MRILYFLLTIGSLLLISCKSNIAYETGSYTRSDIPRTIGYEKFSSKKASDKLAIILEDTMDMQQSEFSSLLRKNDYTIIFPSKAGDDVYEVRELDNKPERTNDIIALYRSLDTSYSNILLAGFGESAYIIPAVSSAIQADISLIVNAGPYSMLQEYEYWLQSDSLNPAQEEILLQKNLWDKDELQERIEKIKSDVSGLEQLAPSTNFYWMSYYDNPLIADLGNFYGNMYWLVSREYPLISDDSRELAKTFSLSFPKLTFVQLKGKGNFSKEEEMQELLQHLEDLIIKH